MLNKKMSPLDTCQNPIIILFFFIILWTGKAGKRGVKVKV